MCILCDARIISARAESALTEVIPQRASCFLVRHEDVDVPIVIKIRSECGCRARTDDTGIARDRPSRYGILQECLFRNIGESAIAVITIQL